MEGKTFLSLTHHEKQEEQHAVRAADYIYDTKNQRNQPTPSSEHVHLDSCVAPAATFLTRDVSLKFPQHSS